MFGVPADQTAEFTRLIPYRTKDGKKSCIAPSDLQSNWSRARPAFREAFKRRRCLVVPDGLYEWQKLDGGAKQPYRIVMRATSH